eukprot:TRINITY_DN426_c0_g1_i4.p1 TRINITY_DN426_c0_g1~~TRINITY_DN426_c0_g1_i4.p1  ORF type:complete len:238 (+),score=34.14 TRINITY_DN426_c0_g1_i4:751-1464(+)
MWHRYIYSKFRVLMRTSDSYKPFKATESLTKEGWTGEFGGSEVKDEVEELDLELDLPSLEDVTSSWHKSIPLQLVRVVVFLVLLAGFIDSFFSLSIFQIVICVIGFYSLFTYDYRCSLVSVLFFLSIILSSLTEYIVFLFMSGEGCDFCDKEDWVLCQFICTRFRPVWWLIFVVEISLQLLLVVVMSIWTYVLHQHANPAEKDFFRSLVFCHCLRLQKKDTELQSIPHFTEELLLHK